MSTDRVCIIILNWNSHQDAIRAVGLLSGSPWEILLVDNGSKDASPLLAVVSEVSGIRLLETGENLGYAGGMNVGMRWAKSNGFTHALLLNPDTAPSIEVIEDMLRISNDCAVVGTAQRTEEGSSYLSAATLNGRKVIPFECSTSCGEGHEVDIVSGAALLIDLAKAESINYMDERFFHYKEEFDFCYRVVESGERIRYNCKSTLIHRRGGSLPGTSPTAAYYSFRNEMLFLRKHFGRFVPLTCFGLYRNALLSLVKRPSNGISILRGLMHGLGGVTGPLFNLGSEGTQK